MAPPPDPEPFRAEFRRRIVAWRAALLGVPSPSAETPDPRATKVPVQLMTPGGQAEIELRRPQAQFWQPIILGAFASMYAVMFGAPFGVPGVLVSIGGVLGSSVAYAFHRRRKSLRESAGRSLNSAFNLIGLGKLRDASDVLDAVEARVTETWALRLVDIQRAIIAIRRGEMAPAEHHLTSAMERPIVGFARENALYQLEGARALRAFVRAALGKHEEARADIADVRSGNPTDDAAARVTLAEAMILEQQGKREELRLLLAEKSTLLLEHTHPRERAIVRAFQRLVRSGKGSVYRRAEPRQEKPQGEEPMLADWVAKVAPGAASFVRSSRAAEQTAKIAPAQAISLPSDEAIRRNQEAKKPRKKNTALKTAAYLAAVAAVFAGVWGFLGADGPPTAADTAGAAAARAAESANLVAMSFAVLLGMIPVMYALVRSLQWISRKRAEAAARTGTKGHAAGPPTREQLMALTESPSPVVAAQAWLLLADRAERRGDFQEVLTRATSGLARLATPQDRTLADIVYPDLLSMRAFALAACGRAEESNAELAALGPSYPHFSRAVFRARLVTLTRSGNGRGAAAWVEQGEADLPLSVREELLADLVRATVHPEQAGAGEIQRLKDELATMPDAKTWIRTVAPGLLEAFENATVAELRMRIESEESPFARPPGASASAPETHDHQAEEEAAAEQELAGPGLRYAR